MASQLILIRTHTQVATRELAAALRHKAFGSAFGSAFEVRRFPAGTIVDRVAGYIDRAQVCRTVWLVQGFAAERIPPLILGNGIYFALSGVAPFRRLTYPPHTPGALFGIESPELTPSLRIASYIPSHAI